MVGAHERDTSVENQAAAVLSAALAQVNAIDRAIAVSRDSRLTSARERVLDIVSEIKAALQSGDLTAASLTALAASVNIGADGASLAEESESAAIAARVELASASFESHATVSRMAADLFDRHEFDADVARHTFGADLDMLDADANGAGDNPDFRPKWDELKAKTDRLREAMLAAGRSTKEYDENTTEYVKAFLKAKGHSEDQVKEALAKSKNPLDAAEPYLSGDAESKKLANHIGLSAGARNGSASAVVADGPPEQALTIDIDAMNAKLAAAGLGAPTKNTEDAGHGLSISKQKPVGTIER